MSSPAASGVEPRIALVGTPNVGKSVLFNALTGAYTTVSNYPGTSVEVARGHCTIGGRRFQVYDTPGMYSLAPITEEEKVARDLLLEERPDVLLHVLDARNLERMLPMTLQLLEAGLPVILVVNILDEAERLGIRLDLARLQQRLGIPVIGAAAARGRGLEEIRRAVAGHAPVKMAALRYAEDLERNIATVEQTLTVDFGLTRRALTLLLLQKDESLLERVRQQDAGNFPWVEAALRQVAFERRSDLQLRISLERKRLCRELLDGVVQQPDQIRTGLADRLSMFSMNPWTGVPLLLLVLYFGLYQFVGNFGAGTLVNWIEGGLFEAWLNPLAVDLGQRYLAWDWLRELVVGEYGVVTLGVRYAVAIVLPIVGTFFVAFSFLEDTGYFPRLALLVDRLFKGIGLNGRAVIPLVLGFGCDTMATLVTRTLETRRERIIATVLLALAIPCSAQLGVILGLLSGVPGALAVWTGCVLTVFVLVGFLAARIIPGERPLFYIEIPPLRMPQLRNVAVKTYTRMYWYFLEIFPLFILASVLLWAGKMTGVFDWVVAGMAPVVAALGLPGETAVAFIFGFFRRDFGAAGLYDLQTAGLLTPVQLTVAAVTLTLFVPCIAQFLVMKKERGWSVALAIFAFVTLSAFGTGWLLNRLLLWSGALG